MMLSSPVVALGLGWDAFFPVMLTSILGGSILLVSKSISTHMFVGKLTAELVQALVFSEKHRRDLVLGELKAAEGKWFLAELPRAKAELKRKQERKTRDCCANVRWLGEFDARDYRGNLWIGSNEPDEEAHHRATGEQRGFHAKYVNLTRLLRMRLRRNRGNPVRLPVWH